jgi:hypothetical protein
VQLGKLRILRYDTEYLIAQLARRLAQEGLSRYQVRWSIFRFSVAMLRHTETLLEIRARLEMRHRYKGAAELAEDLAYAFQRQVDETSAALLYRIRRRERRRVA